MTTYLHVDMDAFVASVEELFDPSLKGNRSSWAGRPNESAAWSSAASYAARNSGCTPRCRADGLQIMPAGHLRRRPSRPVQIEYSHKVFEVLNRFSPKVEMASIDEAFSI